MRVILFVILAVLIVSCDSNRVYEKNYDFEERIWFSKDQPGFEFKISDTTAVYNLYCNIRNSADYPYSRIFINYTLQDSSGTSVSKNMIHAILFEEKTGKPLGRSGLGDVYDQQIPLIKNYSFRKPGMYNLKFEQFMRTDTLQGILAVGFRLENSLPAK